MTPGEPCPTCGQRTPHPDRPRGRPATPHRALLAADLVAEREARGHVHSTVVGLVADLMGITPRAVRQHLRRAKAWRAKEGE